MVFTLEMLQEFLEEEGFGIQAVDDFDYDPDGPPHLRHTPWQAVGVELPCGVAGAVEIVRSTAELYVWVMDQGPADVIARVPLADPDCFDKVAAALRTPM